MIEIRYGGILIERPEPADWPRLFLIVNHTPIGDRGSLAQFGAEFR